jgi:DNA (cytosine-5)-methyltransferase 1
MKIAIIDLFCGAGGTTTGVEHAKMFGKKVAKVIACVNHDATAIASHKSNHKGVLHFTEDIRTLNLDRLLKLVQKYKEQGYVIAIWASLECTNFSNAKGGQPRNADSRTLAEHLHRYIGTLSPEYIFVENVVEFMSWGGLDDKGKPISRDKGKDYLKWTDDICTYFGVYRSKPVYRYDYAIINSADFGAHTSRKRYFGVFASGDFPISFPKATHSKNPSKETDLFSKPLKKWKPVKEVLDLEDEGNSIFERKKELSEKTLARIYAGLMKYVAGGNETFIAKYFSGRPAGKVISTDSPAGTITCVDGQALVKANFMLKYNSTNKNGVHHPPSVNEPCPVIACQNRLGVVSANFLTKYHGNGDNILSLEDVCSTITTKDRLAKVAVKPWLDKHYSSEYNHQSIESPAGTILTKDKYSLVTPKHNYIINPSWFGNIMGIDQPACTIIARQDKSPVYLITAPEGKFNIPVYEGDSECMVKIKEFMALYNIIDIKMRMLKVSELLSIQGFPKKYILKGNQSQQKKFIGNSVVPKVAELLIKETFKALVEYFELRNAA